MAKKRKKKWPYKYVRPDQYDEMSRMSNEELVDLALRKDTNAKAEAKNKKNSEAIKSLAKDINAHRKHHEETSDKFEEAKEAFEEQKAIRDSDINDLIEDKKALEKGYSDTIKQFKEECGVALKILKERKNVATGE